MDGSKSLGKSSQICRLDNDSMNVLVYVSLEYLRIKHDEIKQRRIQCQKQRPNQATESYDLSLIITVKLMDQNLWVSLYKFAG